ncbi:MAG: hypothetical protein KDA99_05210, partial [Planctomycetales bacterium]|nr:hypothetical protein [Planctomycetales bacterium]
MLDNGDFLTLTTITEDQTNNSGNTIAQILASGGGDPITDADAGALEGIAVTAVTGSNGTWQFDTGSGWTDVGTVSSTSALLLRATDSLRFVPNGILGDTATVLFQAWDQTSGTAGTKVDSSISDGSTAFSSQVEVAVVSVTSVNDAPSGADNTIVINEDTSYTFAAADFGFSDVDGNSFNRVWIMTLPGAGQLKYNGSTFAANNWILKSDIDLGLLTFEPAADANGTSYASFDFQVQDSGGTANGGVNRDPTSNTITFDVTAQNDDPTADHGGPYTINEGDSLSLDASSSADIDGDTLVYRWDLDNDGFYDELVTGVAAPSLTWATLSGLGLDDDGSYTIGLQVDDGNGGVVNTSTTLTIINVAPTLTASGAATAAGGATYTLTLTDTDPGNDSISSWTVNWGDGSIDTYAGDPASVTHVYSNSLSGFTLNISVSAIDEDGQYFEANMLAPAYSGSYVAEYDGYDGTYLGTFAPSSDGISGHANITIGPNGNYYVSGHGSGNVVEYLPDGTLVGTFVNAGSGGLSGAGGLAFGADGNLYVASANTNQVLRYDGSTGAFIDAFVPNTTPGLSFPLGLAFGPNGDLYVASRGSAGILKFDGATGAHDTSFIVGSIGGTEDIAFGPDGNIYAADLYGGVLKFDATTGTSLGTFVSIGSGGLTSAAGIEFGPDGSLYVADQDADVVRRYDGTTGAYIDDYATGTVDGPAYMAFTPDHRVTISHTNQNPTAITPTTVAINENTDTTAGFSLGTLVTTDPDSGDTFAYTIVGGADQAKFS